MKPRQSWEPRFSRRKRPCALRDVPQCDTDAAIQPHDPPPTVAWTTCMLRMVAPRSAARNGGSFPPRPCGRALAANRSYHSPRPYIVRDRLELQSGYGGPLCCAACLSPACRAGTVAAAFDAAEVGIRHHLAWCAEFAQGLLPLVIDAAQPRRDHLSGTLQVFGNADVDKVAAKQLCAEQLLADQPRE